MRAEGLQGASFVFNHTRIAKNISDCYFFQTKCCTVFGTSNNSSTLDRDSKGTLGYEGLRKAANNFPCRGGRKNVGIRDSVISGKGFAKTKIQDLLAGLWHSEVLHIPMDSAGVM